MKKKKKKKKNKGFSPLSGRDFKVCIFGDDGVGKNTLVNRVKLTKLFDEDIKMTVGAEFYVKDLEIDGKKVIIKFWVFRSEKRFKVLLPSFAKGADAGIFMYDITRYTSIKNIDDWLSIFEKNVREKEILIPIIMVANKVDDKQHRVVSQVDAVEIQEKYNLASYIEISAITGENVKKMFDVIINLMLKRTEGGDYFRSKTERLGNFDEEIAYMYDEEIAEVVKERLRERERLARESEEKFKKYKKNIANVKYVREKKIMQSFLNAVSNDTGLVAYGLEEVQKALNMGAVAKLILSEKLDTYQVDITCSNCNYKESRTAREREKVKIELSIQDESCPNCGSNAFNVSNSVLIVEALGSIAETMGSEVIIISPDTEEGEMLYSTFGGIVAILRFKLSY